MKMEMELSSLFHRHIDFMMTTDDRLLHKSWRPVGIWWLEFCGEDLIKHVTSSDFLNACRVQDPDRWDRMGALVRMGVALRARQAQLTKRPGVAFYDFITGSRLVLFSSDPLEPSMMCAVSPRDAMQMRREARDKNLMIRLPREASIPLARKIQPFFVPKTNSMSTNS